MPQGMKWAKETQDDIRIDPAGILGNVTKGRNNVCNWYGRIREKSSEWKLNDIMARTMQWCGRGANQPTNQKWKETGAELKEAKARIQAIPSPKKKRDLKNEDLMTHPFHKRLNKQ